MNDNEEQHLGILFSMQKVDNKRGELIEDIFIILGLVGVQFVYAGNSMLLSYFLRLGFHPSSLIIFSSFATFLVLSPLASFFERKQWPGRISYKFVIQVLLLSFGGTTVFQTLFMKGIHLTSPVIATAMPNMAPGLIFFIAWACKLERVKMGCIYSRAKIAGTLLCVLGAVLMSLMQTAAPPDDADADPSSPANLSFDKGTMLGCIYLIAAVFVLSSQVVLQAITLRDFPASMTLCSMTSLVGMAMTAAVHMVGEHKWGIEWPAALTIPEMMAYFIVAGSVGGYCVAFNSWAMRKRGPVVVSVFNPLGTLISAAVSAIMLREFIGMGCLTGMCLMFTGLYFVLWAKGKEQGLADDADDDSHSQSHGGSSNHYEEGNEHEDGLTRPLLA